MQPLDPAILKVWRVAGAAIGGPPAIAGIVVLLASGAHALGWVAAVVGIVIAIVAIGVAPGLRYRRFRWGLADGVLRVRDGVVWHTETTVPVFRIQHIDLQQGPLDRWAGLQQLTVHTAAPGADLELPGITVAHAPELRTRLLELSREAVGRFDRHEGSDAV